MDNNRNMFNRYNPTSAERLNVRIKGVYTLWREWLLAFGAIMLTVVLDVIISNKILPLFVLALAWLLKSYNFPLRERRLLACVRVTSLTASALVWTAIVMIVSLAVCFTPLLNNLFPPDTLNPEIPYVASLIVFPVTTVVMAVASVNEGNSRYCRECKMRFGFSPEDSFAGSIFHSEATFQIRLMMWLSLVLSVACGIYYFGFYSNANYNGADKYFFIYVPLTLYVASLLYTGARCHSLISTLRVTSEHGVGSATTLRYLIVHGDKVLLQTGEPDSADAYVLADTPAITTVAYTGTVDDKAAADNFARLAGIGVSEFRLRPLYNNLTVDGQSNVFHYGVILDADKPLPGNFALHGEWVTLDQIGRLWNFHGITGTLAAEINRILTVTMAWKTYDENGYRRYPIKNYRPTFRLRDFPEWTVDYQDPVWLSVASNNQDQPMFHIRRFLRKITRNTL